MPISISKRSQYLLTIILLIVISHHVPTYIPLSHSQDSWVDQYFSRANRWSSVFHPFLSICLVILGFHFFHRLSIPKKGPNFSLSQSPVFQKPRHQVFREVWQKVRPGVGYPDGFPQWYSHELVLDGDLGIPHDPPFSSIAPIKFDIYIYIYAIQNRFWMMNLIWIWWIYDSILFLGRLNPGSTSLKLLAKDHPGCSL